jgi:hypothetical protein
MKNNLKLISQPRQSLADNYDSLNYILYNKHLNMPSILVSRIYCPTVVVNFDCIAPRESSEKTQPQTEKQSAEDAFRDFSRSSKLIFFFL